MYNNRPGCVPNTKSIILFFAEILITIIIRFELIRCQAAGRRPPSRSERQTNNSIKMRMPSECDPSSTAASLGSNIKHFIPNSGWGTLLYDFSACLMAFTPQIPINRRSRGTANRCSILNSPVLHSPWKRNIQSTNLLATDAEKCSEQFRTMLWKLQRKSIINGFRKRKMER